MIIPLDRPEAVLKIAFLIRDDHHASYGGQHEALVMTALHWATVSPPAQTAGGTDRVRDRD